MCDISFPCDNNMIDSTSGTLSQVCGGLFRKSSDYLTNLVRSVSGTNDIRVSTNTMYSSSASSVVSSSSAMSVSNSSNSSLSLCPKENNKPDMGLQSPFSKKWERRRSTSLIEWKKAPPIKAPHANTETKNLNILTTDDFLLTRTATNYLDNNYTPTHNDIRNIRFPSSASTSQLPTSASTPEFPRSATISRTNSTRTNCSCFSCTMPGMYKTIHITFHGKLYCKARLLFLKIKYFFPDHISLGTGRSFPSFPRQRRSSQIIFDFQVRDFYDVLDVLGEGSFSTVYLAESVYERGGYAAIKVIQKTDLMKTKKIPEVHKR